MFITNSSGSDRINKGERRHSNYSPCFLIIFDWKLLTKTRSLLFGALLAINRIDPLIRVNIESSVVLVEPENVGTDVGAN